MPRGADPSRSATDALFVTDPREFVRARNALAAELARAGRAEEAAGVKRLPRLALPAWVLNRLARDAPEEVAALLATGERLRSAQSEALGGGGGGRLRAEMAELRRTLARLRERAQGVLAGSGHPASAAVLQRVEAGLRAAAVAGGEPAEQLRAGRLSREPEDAGLGALASSTRAPSAAARSARGEQHLEPRREESRAAALERKRQESERRRAEAVARQRAREKFRAQRRAGEEAARLDREAARLARAAEDAARKAEDATKAAREARNRAEHARREAEALRAAASQPPTVH